MAILFNYDFHETFVNSPVLRRAGPMTDLSVDVNYQLSTEILLESQIAVSYTHLDVYKRQILTLSA